MKRKKRRQEAEASRASAPAPVPGLYRPFRELREKLPAAETGKAPAVGAGSSSGVGVRNEKRRTKNEERPGADDDAFAAVVSGVAPFERDVVTRRVTVPPPPPEDELATAERFLSAMVVGDVPFDYSDTDEYVEGRVRGLDVRLLQRLRKGQYAVESHLDLHGLDRHEAKAALRAFLEATQREGKRCVLVVHGRGLCSKDGIPVLRERMKEWLSRGGIGRQVLAFTSARPVDGGTGAVYVLLRR